LRYIRESWPHDLPPPAETRSFAIRRKKKKKEKGKRKGGRERKKKKGGRIRDASRIASAVPSAVSSFSLIHNIVVPKKKRKGKEEEGGKKEGREGRPGFSRAGRPAPPDAYLGRDSAASYKKYFKKKKRGEGKGTREREKRIIGMGSTCFGDFFCSMPIGSTKGKRRGGESGIAHARSPGAGTRRDCRNFCKEGGGKDKKVRLLSRCASFSAGDDRDDRLHQKREKGGRRRRPESPRGPNGERCGDRAVPARLLTKKRGKKGGEKEW